LSNIILLQVIGCQEQIKAASVKLYPLGASSAPLPSWHFFTERKTLGAIPSNRRFYPWPPFG